MQKIKTQNLELATKEMQAKIRRSLNGSELRLYLYLLDTARESPEGSFPFNRWEAIEYYGIGISSFTKAVRGLKDKGYLRKRINSGILYFDAVGGLKA